MFSNKSSNSAPLGIMRIAPSRPGGKLREEADRPKIQEGHGNVQQQIQQLCRIVAVVVQLLNHKILVGRMAAWMNW